MKLSFGGRSTGSCDVFNRVLLSQKALLHFCKTTFLILPWMKNNPFFFVKKKNKKTTFNGGSLGSRIDEERSELRYVVWIAEFRESSNLRTHIALQLFWLKHVCLSIMKPYFPTFVGWRELQAFCWQRQSCEKKIFHFLFLVLKTLLHIKSFNADVFKTSHSGVVEIQIAWEVWNIA